MIETIEEKCLICSSIMTRKWIRGHIRFKHKINEAVEGKDFIIKHTTQEEDTLPMTNLTYKPLPQYTTEVKYDNVSMKIKELEDARAKRRLRALEENELLAIELENKRMRDDLT